MCIRDSRRLARRRRNAEHVVFDRIDDHLTLASWELDDVVPPSSEAAPEAEVGALAPVTKPPQPWTLEITPTLVVSTALATRDFQDVHHDRDLAVQRGSKDIFLNILTTTGLVQRYVGDWARATGRAPIRITACELRLGAPAHPYDTLTVSGTVAEEGVPAEGGATVVDVVGQVSLGDHVTARVTFVREGGEA